MANPNALRKLTSPSGTGGGISERQREPQTVLVPTTAARRTSSHFLVAIRRGARDADPARIEVQDGGPDLSAEDQQKLFGKFARLSAKPTGGEHATGLGLSIVKRMVEAMNGKVWCESEPGQGARFILTLPEPSRK